MGVVRGGRADDRQAVVLGQIASLAALGAEAIGQTASGVFGHVLVEGAWLGASEQDALDGLHIEGALQGCVGQRGIQVTGVVSLAQEQDAARMMRPLTGWSAAEQAEEVVRPATHLLEG